ncbi:MAG: hypothetical protein ACLRXQ_10195 [Phascolarctobacterium faecium]
MLSVNVLDLEALDDGQNVAITAIINEAKKSGKTVNEVKNYVEAIKNAAPAGGWLMLRRML